MSWIEKEPYVSVCAMPCRAPSSTQPKTLRLPPWLYLAAEQPERCAAVLDFILAKVYGARRDGLPDNEDMGAQSTFVIGALIDLYPQVGSDRWWGFTSTFRPG